MPKMKHAVLGAVVLITTWGSSMTEVAQLDPSKTIYGDRSPSAPKELAAFAFLIGKFQGTGHARRPDGTVATFGAVTWIGRYVLDGTAIADEGHSHYPDGRPALGVTLRHYDTSRKTWVVEFLNVSESFLRKQVNGRSGSVEVDGQDVRIVMEGPPAIREIYHVVDPDRWTYRLDLSTDGGRTWNEGQVEMSLRRSE